MESLANPCHIAARPLPLATLPKVNMSSLKWPIIGETGLHFFDAGCRRALYVSVVVGTRW